MSIKTLKISYAVESVIQISEDGAASLLRNYRLIRDGVVPPWVANVGLLNATEKLHADADEDLILRTILGEVTSIIITNEVPACYPKDKGFKARISKVSYQETPEKLDPPSDATPLVVHVGDRNVH